MKSRLFFRQSGYPIRTSRRAWLWPSSAVLAVVALLALTTHLDDSARAQDSQAAAGAERTRIFEAGRSAGHAEMIASAQTAWQAAGAEADHRCGRRLP